MSVNDLLVQGAEPLFFLDYYACSRLEVEVAAQVVKGIAQGCRQSGCALIGGETAEMPGMYQPGLFLSLSIARTSLTLCCFVGDYDLAGFALGAVERSLVLPNPQNPIRQGDVLLGLSSSGVHANGFSLVREIVARSPYTYSSPCPWSTTQTLGRALVEPTRIYVAQVLPVCQRGLIKGLSHITGGGFIENVPRVLPGDLGCVIDVSTWPWPDVFRWLKTQGGVAGLEMARTFNNGIGMVVIVDEEEKEKVVEMLREGGGGGGGEVYEIGKVVKGKGVEMRNLEMWA